MTLKQLLMSAEMLVKRLKEASTLIEMLEEEKDFWKPENVLTPKEKEIYKLFSDGKDVHEIAATLHLSKKTVDVHKESIKRKMKFKSSRDLYRSFRKEKV